MPSDQLLVFFRDYPTLSASALAQFISSVDPDEKEECEIQPLTEQVHAADDETRKLGLEDEPLRVSGMLLSLGEFNLSVLAHNIPAPDTRCITQSNLREEIKQSLRDHSAFALLTLTGGEQYSPRERVVMLTKIALGLCEQGAIGIGCPGGMTAIDCQTLQSMVRIMRDNDSSLWKILREDGAPRILYSNKLLYGHDEREWVISFGLSLLRLPDLAVAIGDASETEQAAEVLEDLLDYLIQKGPVLQPGQTLSVRQQTYVVEEPPADLEVFQRDNGVLVLTRQSQAAVE